MSIFDKPVQMIRATDLQEVLNNPVETERLDYKSNVYDLTRDRGKAELRKDIAAFANHRGGMIVCGIDAEHKRLVDLNIADINKYIEQLIQIVNTPGLIEPSIQGWSLHAVPEGQPQVLIIKVPMSFDSPHWVRMPDKKYGQFFVRHGTVNEEMSYEELRARFLGMRDRLSAMGDFHLQRIERLSKRDDQDIPADLGTEAQLIVHCFPSTFEDTTTRIDFRSDHIALIDDFRQPFIAESRSYNGKGAYQRLISHDRSQSLGYIHLFSNGLIEFNQVLQAEPSSPRQLNLNMIESYILQNLALCFNLAQRFKQALPYQIYINIINLQQISHMYHWFNDDIHGRSREDLPVSLQTIHLPNFTLDNEQPDIYRVIQKSFDVLWNHAGFAASPSYDADGNWLRKNLT